MVDTPKEKNWTENDIAIVGMAAHLPGSSTLDDYWHNLRNGIESITRLDEEALRAAGEDPGLLRKKNYVPVAALLEDYDKFDADFFGLSPKEAAIMDPQHRKFLEVSWEALEIAGHVPERFEGPIGVFAGCGMGSYFYFNICSNRDLVDSTGMFLLRHTGNDKDFLSTRLSHILDLNGPSLSVQTACSTSLVATHYACQSLLNGECDMALAGGVTIELPQGRGYLHQEGEILSPDGHCHAFDHRAEGTVFGSGAGVVVLRRLKDALADNDHIWGVIRGTAVNNDGSDKAGYLAPSVQGQAAAVAEAQGMADVSADTIDYVECHGTGTYLGDPIEVTALTEAFRETTQDAGYCRIGSVKTNIGHLDTAAGAASLIKTALSLHHKELPPTLGYEAPNPAIDFDSSPFRVNDRLQDWISHKGPRRAAVNSLGVGGTNAHVVLEEAPAQVPSEETEWPFHLIAVSGHNNRSLEGNAKALAAYLRHHPDVPLADVAYTLQEGRRAFEKRRVFVARSHDEAIALLEENSPSRVFTHSADQDDPDLVFMFPGGGAQYARMAQDLYETEPVFREWMEQGFEVLKEKTGRDLRDLWLADGVSLKEANAQLTRPSLQLPLIMITEYALAQLWISWGVIPSALVGHSMGENTAACLAGVMSFEDCIGLVLLRGQLFDRVPKGGMVSVPLSVQELQPFLTDDLNIAAENAAELTVVSGPQTALDALIQALEKADVQAQRIPIDIAAHSAMLDLILDEFRAYLQSIALQAPQIPIVSNRSGTILKDEEATDPDYWVAHLRGTVLFAECVATLSMHPNRVYLEVGPGKTLSSLTRMHPSTDATKVLSSLRHPDEEIEDDLFFLGVLGRLWACGVSFDWSQIWGEARRNRVVLPTYAFQKTRYFIEPSQQADTSQHALMRQEDMADWGYRMAWVPQLADCDPEHLAAPEHSKPHSWLLFLDEGGTGIALADKLRTAGHNVTTVSAGDAFAKTSDDHYVLAPERGREGYDQLVSDMIAHGRAPDRILHLWLLTENEGHRPGSSFFHRNLEMGFHAFLSLGQSIVGETLPMPAHVIAVTNGAERVAQEALPYPEKSVIRGPLGVLPREVPGLTALAVDVVPGPDLVDQLFEECLAEPSAGNAALRGAKRYVQRAKPQPLTDKAPEWQAGETYLITGGLGGIGLTIAEDMLAAGANVALQSRRALPPRAEWDKIKNFRSQEDQLVRRLQKVEQLERLKGQLKIVQADVCNLTEMQAALDEIELELGAVRGVIHAAGVMNDGPMLAKTSVDVEEVLAPKLHGTLVLDQLFDDGALDWLVLFSSTSTVTTPAGQVDYAAANAFLNAYAASRAGGKTKVTAVNWGIWADVGMALEAASVPEAGLSEPKALTAPTLQELQVLPDNKILFSAAINATSCWMLDQHRTAAGAAILPGTGYLQLISEAMQALDENRAYEVRDLMFLRAFEVADGETRTLRLALRETALGYDMEILGSHQDGFVLHAEARISLKSLAPPREVDLGVLAEGFPALDEAASGSYLVTDQETHLKFGKHWQTLTARALSANEGFARLALTPELRDEMGQMALHPGLLDIGTGWAMQLIDGYTPDHLWVPLSYRALRHYGALPSEIVSHIRCVEGSGDMGSAQFDVTLLDMAGRTCVEVEGLTLKKLEQGTALGQSHAIPAQEIMRDETVLTDLPILSAGERRLQEMLVEGIPSTTGAEALRRAMASDRAQIIVSSLDLEGLIAQVDFESTAAEESSQGFERPDLETDFVAPRNDLERMLAGFWKDLLGIEEIGVEDNFFDVGGHSLIAVRLFAMVKKTYRVEFPISVLFEAPTIALCAAMIEARIGPQDRPEEASGAEIIPVTLGRESRYDHLVPMHSAQGSEKTPFFLVAGMYGNVLNLRHLGHLIGADRPFYGLQARGLFGEAKPHDDIVAAAHDYIAEMRQVQPVGPYMIGGFSGGGITAYEIAQQLEAAGEEVALVVMLDTPLPQRRALTRADRLRIQWQELRVGGLGYVMRWAGNRLTWELAKFGRAPVVEVDDSQFHNAEIEAAFLHAVAGYAPRQRSGRTVLYRPPLTGKWEVTPGRWVDKDRAYVFADNDWGQFVSELEVCEVPGDHDSMVLEPNVRVLATQISKAIEEAESASQVVVPFRKAAG